MNKILFAATILVLSITAKAQNAVPEFKNKVMMVTATNNLEPLESTTLTYGMKSKVGSGSVFWKADDVKAGVVYTAGNKFIVKIETGVDPESIVSLYQFDVDKKMRKIPIGKVGMRGGDMAAMPVIKLSFTKVEDGVYTISPKATLEEGEYIFIVNQPLSSTSMQGEIKGFAVSVAK